MSVKIRPVPIELDRPRRLIVDLNAIDLAEELTGRNLLDLAAWRDLDAGALKRLVYACLVRDDEETRDEAEPLTLEQVGAMLHPGNLRETLDALLTAARHAYPEPEEEGDEEDEDKEDGEEDASEDPPRPGALLP